MGGCLVGDFDYVCCVWWCVVVGLSASCFPWYVIWVDGVGGTVCGSRGAVGDVVVFDVVVVVWVYFVELGTNVSVSAAFGTSSGSGSARAAVVPSL